MSGRGDDVRVIALVAGDPLTTERHLIDLADALDLTPDGYTVGGWIGHQAEEIAERDATIEALRAEVAALRAIADDRGFPNVTEGPEALCLAANAAVMATWAVAAGRIAAIPATPTGGTGDE